MEQAPSMSVLGSLRSARPFLSRAMAQAALAGMSVVPAKFGYRGPAMNNHQGKTEQMLAVTMPAA